MLKRDEHGIIIQEISYLPGYADGGDSAFSTGMMGLTGSEQDLKFLHKFLVKVDLFRYRLVRHPYQAQHANHKATSRDQLIAWAAGVSKAKREKLFMSDALMFYAKGWRINKDILLPHVKSYLYKCAGENPPLWLEVLAIPMHFFSILWDCYIKPNHEMNQSICLASVRGKWWLRLLVNRHPDLYKNIYDYYYGWRMKDDIGERLINFVKMRVK